MSDAMPQMLRSDARQNRDRVLAAARELFASSGLDVPMRTVARHAQVGPATLYRRFPTKRHLIQEAFLDELEACRSVVRDAAADPDAWRGFRAVLDGLAVLNARNQGLTDAILATYPDAVDLPAHRAEMLREIAGIARRAKAAGDLRADFVLDDVVLVLLAGRGISAGSLDDRVAAARRFAALVLDGLHASGSSSPLPRRAPGRADPDPRG